MSKIALYRNNYNDLIADAERELEKLDGSAPKTINLAPLAIPGAIARSILDFSSLFRTETSINSFTLSIPENPIVSLLGAKCKKVKIYHPSMYLIDIKSKISNLDNVWSELEPLLEKVLEASNYISKFENIGEAKLTDNQKTILTGLKTQNNLTGSLFEELSKVSDNKNDLYMIAKAKTLHENLLKGNNTYILKIEVVDGGGSNRTIKNLLSSRIRFTGGSVVSHILFARDGSILSSGITYNHSAQTKIDPDVPLTNISNLSNQ